MVRLMLGDMAYDMRGLTGLSKSVFLFQAYLEDLDFVLCILVKI